jgi:predicted ester cyclase
VSGISITCLSGGKIVEEQSNWDNFGMMRQLGVIDE